MTNLRPAPTIAHHKIAHQRYNNQNQNLFVVLSSRTRNSSYDEDEDYEPNIDILESQLDDCILNEWWETVKIESAEDFERAERAIQEQLNRL